MRLVLLGSPGAGKGTQAVLITQHFQIPQVSTGDMLRAAIKAGSPLGLRVQQMMAEGKLAPDDLMIELVKERIAQADCANGFLLDGFPRTIPQAEALKAHDINLDYIVEIFVGDDELIKRLSGRRIHPASGRIYHLINNPPQSPNTDDVTGEPLVQRPDDEEATVRKRLAVYHAQTEPLIKFYQRAANHDSKVAQFIRVDGTLPVDEVKNAIITAIGK